MTEPSFLAAIKADVQGHAVHPDGLTDEQVALIVAAEEQKK